MRLFYRISYLLGFTPWEEASTHPPAAKHIDALFTREEQERGRSLGRALDLGCGRGYWSIELARRGWRVTGVELVPRAVRAARAAAVRAGVEVEIIRADVTAMRSAGVEPPFQFIWDFGMLHGLTPAQRRAAAQEITALAAPDATMLLLAWTPGRRGPLPRGASREDIASAFADWSIIDEQPFDVTGLPDRLQNVDPRMYRLRRG